MLSVTLLEYHKLMIISFCPNEEIVLKTMASYLLDYPLCIVQSDCIARISYKDGKVIGWILLPNLREGLLTAGYKGIDVLNGIAWDSEEKRLFVTGKLWPNLYEIQLHPVERRFDDGVIEQLCLRMPFNF